MRALFIGVVLAIGLLPPATFAQGERQSASPPNRSLGQSRSPGPIVRSPGPIVRSHRPIARSPGRPVQRLANSPRTPRGDVFLARPRTFRPGRSELFLRDRGYYRYPHYPFPIYLYSYPYPYPYYPPEQVYPDPEPTVIVFPPTPAEATPAAPPPPTLPPEPYVTGPPGPPKTFYVIPGCYIGDRRPASRLQHLAASRHAAVVVIGTSHLKHGEGNDACHHWRLKSLAPSSGGSK